MNLFLLGLCVGLMVGVPLGFLALSLCVMARGRGGDG